jgi:hypothetical protein
MHAIAMAIRQLTHRSIARSIGFGLGTRNNAALMARHRGIAAGARQPQLLTQAQSDARMGRDLRTLQGISMQMGAHGYSTPGHARALAHLRRAMQELHTALSIR